MENLVPHFIELIRRASTDLPADIEAALRQARANEDPGSAAQTALDAILENVRLSRQGRRPSARTPARRSSMSTIPPAGPPWPSRSRSARRSPRRRPESYLRPNSVDTLTGKNPGNNLGDDFPYFHFEEWEEDYLKVDLMLKGGGCENVGAQYSLPDTAARRRSRSGRGAPHGVGRGPAGAGHGLRARRDRRGRRRRPGVELH